MDLSVVVPNYNGAELLPRYLPSMVESARLAGTNRVIVVDDASTDGSAAVAGRIAPGIQVIARKINGGFGEAVNEGVQAADSALVAVCMTDMELEPECLTAAREAFADDVFAVDFHLKVSEELGNAGVTALPFKRGLFHTEFPGGSAKTSYQSGRTGIAFAVGGAMVVRRDRFLDLGGFDSMYAPFFWEDIDLCWRSWMRGWRCLNAAGAVAWHRHAHLTVNNSSAAEKRETIIWRNRIAFIRKNIHDAKLLRQHRIWMMIMLAMAARRGNRTLRTAEKQATEAVRALRDTAHSEKMAWSERELVRYLAQPHPQGEGAVP